MVRVRLTRDLDMLYIIAYIPPQRNRAAHPDAQKVWHWISAAIRETSNKCTPIMFMDAN